MVFDLGLDQRKFVFEIGSISKIIVENSRAWGLDVTQDSGEPV